MAIIAQQTLFGWNEIEILGEIGFQNARWENIMVGNIIRVKKDQYFPCDVLLLKHSK